MMRGLRSLILMTVVLGALGAYIYFVESKRDPDAELETREKVFSVQADQIEEVKIRSESGDSSTVRKSDGLWQLVEPETAPADESELASVTSNLASLEIQRVVEEEPENLATYGLENPRAELSFRTAGSTDFRKLLLGDKTPTGGDLYARLDGARRVFLISSYLDGNFNRTTFDLRDKSVLRFERDKIERIAVRNPAGSVELARTAGDWSMAQPVAARADVATAEALVTRLQSTKMNAIVAREPGNLRQYGLDRPQVSATLVTGSSQATLEIGRSTEDERFYARDTSRPLVFTVDKLVFDEINKPPFSFRRKDLFEYRIYTVSRLELTRGSETVAFEKQPPGENGLSSYKQMAPTTRDVDTAKAEDFLSKLSTLRAQSYVEGRTPTGLDAPAVTVVARYDDGKKEERVTIGRVGADAYAARAGEPGVAKIDASELDAALTALDALK